jgi:hypothetical protein
VLLRRRLAVLLAMTMMLVAGPLASSADAGPKPDGGKNNGWGDGNGGGKGHPKNNGCNIC